MSLADSILSQQSSQTDFPLDPERTKKQTPEALAEALARMASESPSLSMPGTESPALTFPTGSQGFSMPSFDMGMGGAGADSGGAGSGFGGGVGSMSSLMSIGSALGKGGKALYDTLFDTTDLAKAGVNAPGIQLSTEQLDAMDPALSMDLPLYDYSSLFDSYGGLTTQAADALDPALFDEAGNLIDSTGSGASASGGLLQGAGTVASLASLGKSAYDVSQGDMAGTPGLIAQGGAAATGAAIGSGAAGAGGGALAGSAGAGALSGASAGLSAAAPLAIPILAYSIMSGITNRKDAAVDREQLSDLPARLERLQTYGGQEGLAARIDAILANKPTTPYPEVDWDRPTGSITFDPAWANWEQSFIHSPEFNDYILLNRVAQGHFAEMGVPGSVVPGWNLYHPIGRRMYYGPTGAAAFGTGEGGEGDSSGAGGGGFW